MGLWLIALSRLYRSCFAHPNVHLLFGPATSFPLSLCIKVCVTNGGAYGMNANRGFGVLRRQLWCADNAPTAPSPPVNWAAGCSRSCSDCCCISSIPPVASHQIYIRISGCAITALSLRESWGACCSLCSCMWMKESYSKRVKNNKLWTSTQSGVSLLLTDRKKRWSLGD